MQLESFGCKVPFECFICCEGLKLGAPATSGSGSTSLFGASMAPVAKSAAVAPQASATGGLKLSETI